jgi:2-polyprenyl-3-methyl-5-hydroxy-6-metoxy-1,4-benzoquinol methylase
MIVIPYFQTTRIRVQAMIDLTQIRSGMRMADLGAGDGRIVIAYAQAGVDSVGFEMDESLIAVANTHIQAAGVTERVSIIQKDFWNEDLSQFDIITIYPMPDVMDTLEEKLKKELAPGAQILLNYYPFNTWQAQAEKEHIYYYIR